MEVVLDLLVLVGAAFWLLRRSGTRAGTPARTDQRKAGFPGAGEGSAEAAGRRTRSRPEVSAPRSTVSYQGPPAQPVLLPLSRDGQVEVVGESHYQPALSDAAGGREVWWDDPAHVTAVLVPEPSNPHDSQAVRVDVDGRTVGYLSRIVAPDYQPALLGLEQEGVSGCCPARIVGGGDLHYGIFLSLGGPAAFVPVNRPDGLELLAPERAVTVTGEERHPEVLTPMLADGDGVRVLFAELATCRIAKGKHAGAEAVEVLLDGRRAGELTKAMSDRYLPLVRGLLDVGGRPGCEAVLSVDHRGPQLELRLPRVE